MGGIIAVVFAIITMSLFFAVRAIVGATLVIGIAQLADVRSRRRTEREQIKRFAMKQSKKECLAGKAA